MNQTILGGLGIAAATVNAVGFIPYIRSILQKKTRPERSSWWIWSGLMIIALFAQLAMGATWSILFTVVFLVGDGVIAILSLKYGYGRFNAKDGLSILIATAGVWLWITTHNAFIALIITIAVNFLGNWLTILKSWRAPYSENLLTWILMSCGALLSMLSIGTLDFALLLFPAYVTLVNLGTVFIVLYRRRWRSRRIRDGRRRYLKKG